MNRSAMSKFAVMMVAALALVGCGEDAKDQTLVGPSGDNSALETTWCHNYGTDAYAYSCDQNICFTTIDRNNDGHGDFDRWGYTNGPLQPGTYTFDLFAGGTDCDPASSVRVGQVEVVYGNCKATVTVTTCGSYTLDDVNIYVGTRPTPRDCWGRWTVDPRFYPYRRTWIPSGCQSSSATFRYLSGPIYVIANASVLGDLANGDCGDRLCEDPCVPSFNPEVLDQALPLGLVNFQVQFQGNVPLFGVDDSMFKGKVTGAGLFDSPEGTFSYSSWCVDLEHDIDSRPAQVTLVSSLNPNSTLLACLVDNPQNIDLMNWVLNQDPAIWGADHRDVEAALWALLDNTFTFCAGDICNKGGLTYRKAVTQQILADAAANGEGYLPPCDGIIGVFADPGCTIDGTLERQVIVIEVPVSNVEGLCTDCE